MRYLGVLLFSIVLIFVGCVSSKKHLDRGQYDMAIRKSVKKLKKKPSNVKEIQVLQRAYQLANQTDREKINYLKLEGNPDIWEQVYAIYLQLKNRQDLVKTLPQLWLPGGRPVNFEFVNYDEEIVNAKRKAADFYYTKGITLLSNNTRESAREAYYNFLNVKKFFKEYKDVDTKISEAIAKGTSYVLFKMENSSGMIIPQAFQDEMFKISLHHLNRQFIQYHTNALKDVTYDYIILLNIKSIDVSPEGVKEVHYTESKEVQDGFQYVLDERGNVKKDSLGNDIKVPKFKTITCNVIEIQQNKAARVFGTVDFINNNTKQLLNTVPLSAESVFQNFAATAQGDLNALSPETAKKLGNRPMPFPSNADMIMRCSETVKNMAKSYIDSNSGLFY
ncbi:MAG: hypothetical protein ACK4IK_00880 [Bacteroidia bacterium]